MDAWLLSIVGISFLAVLVDILFINDKSSKYIKGVFSLIAIYIIISPICIFLSDSKNIENIENGIKINQEYIETFNFKTNTVLKAQIREILLKEGIEKVDINIFKSEDKISRINIYIYEDFDEIKIKELLDKYLLDTPYYLYKKS